MYLVVVISFLLSSMIEVIGVMSMTSALCGRYDKYSFQIMFYVAGVIGLFRSMLNFSDYHIEKVLLYFISTFIAIIIISIYNSKDSKTFLISSTISIGIWSILSLLVVNIMPFEWHYAIRGQYNIYCGMGHFAIGIACQLISLYVHKHQVVEKIKNF